MKIRRFSPGSLVVKIDWNNRPLDHGIVIQQDTTRPLTDTEVLFPSGPRWEGAHDLCHADELPSCN
jgi:hypothetical protein